jgi:hypothetical protein
MATGSRAVRTNVLFAAARANDDQGVEHLIGVRRNHKHLIGGEKRAAHAVSGQMMRDTPIQTPTHC